MKLCLLFRTLEHGMMTFLILVTFPAAGLCTNMEREVLIVDHFPESRYNGSS